MQDRFRASLFGYQRKQVNERINRLTAEYETTIGQLKERNCQLRDNNNFLNAELARYRSMEQEISGALITAHTKANEVLKEREKNAEEEKTRLLDEVRLLDRSIRVLYSRLENTIQEAADIASGFELQLTDLKLRKEAFLKASFSFERSPPDS